MKTTMLGMALAMLVVAPAFTPSAFAQTSSANSESGATSSSLSGSSASTGSSRASVTQVYNFNDPSGDPSGDPTSHVYSQANDDVHYSGGYTVHNVPEIIPPSFGGTNVCAVGASGGVGVAGFGVTLGGSWSDSGCERRSEAVVLYQMGEHNAAIALMCQDKHVAEAMQAVGRGCGPQSRPVATKAPPPLSSLAAAHPAPAAPAPVHLVAAHPAASGACAQLPPNADAADRLMYQYNCHQARP